MMPVFKKGDVLRGAKEHRGKTEALHPIVFLDADGNDFIGAVLTHTGVFRGTQNTPMFESHFERTSEDGGEYNFKFENTHLVVGKFIKFESWGPYEKVGELTSEGIDLGLDNFSDLFPKDFFATPREV